MNRLHQKKYDADEGKELALVARTVPALVVYSKLAIVVYD